MIRSGRIVTAVFQEGAPFGAVIRVAFDADEPVLPPSRSGGPTRNTRTNKCADSAQSPLTMVCT
jgi:hypothetical protein